MDPLTLVIAVVCITLMCLLLLFAGFAWGGFERIAKGLGLCMVALALASCGGGDPAPAVVHPPNTTNIKSTNPDPVIVETPAPITGGLIFSMEVNFPDLPADREQRIMVHLLEDAGDEGALPLVLEHLTICVDATCYEDILTDQDGNISITFAAPESGWSIGRHDCSAEFVRYPQPNRVVGSFVAVLDESGGDE